MKTFAAGADVERAAAVKAAGYTHDGGRSRRRIHLLEKGSAAKANDSPLVVLATSRPEIRAAAEAGAKKHGLVLCDFW
jgi:hypothetical protein